MAIEDKWVKRLNDFVARAGELAEVLPRGMEGQAVGIELRGAIARLQAAITKLSEARPSEAARRTGELRQALGECERWLQLINAARLVQSLRLDELLAETRNLIPAVNAGEILAAETAPAQTASAARCRAPARARARAGTRSRPARSRAAA
jgi:hypothetical protein